MTLLDEPTTRPAPTRRRPTPLEWIDICAVDDLDADRGVCALVDGEPVAIFRCSPWDELFAIGNIDPYSARLGAVAGHRRLDRRPRRSSCRRSSRTASTCAPGASIDDPAVSVATLPGPRRARAVCRSPPAPT